MNALSRAVQLVSLIATGIHLYNYYQEIQTEKVTVFNSLSPSMQAEWISILGNPNPAPIQNLVLPPIAPKPGTLVVAAPITQLKAGT